MPAPPEFRPAGFSSDLSLPAEVVEQGGRVWLRYTCAAHGTVTTAYCANAAFFRRMLSFVDEEASSASSSASSAAAASASPTAGNARRPPLRDLEDLLNIRPASANLPLMVEMDLSRGAELLPDAQV